MADWHDYADRKAASGSAMRPAVSASSPQRLGGPSGWLLQHSTARVAARSSQRQAGVQGERARWASERELAWRPSENDLTARTGPCPRSILRRCSALSVDL